MAWSEVESIRPCLWMDCFHLVRPLCTFAVFIDASTAARPLRWVLVAMHTIRIPAYAPVALPVRPPPPAPLVVSRNPVEEALRIVGIVIGLGISVAMSLATAAGVVLRDVDALSAPAAPIATPPAPIATRANVFVEHDGDDCAAAELRTCVAQPEQEARLCAEMPDPSNAIATAQWIDARCSFEGKRDYSDCVRLMSVINDHCAVIGAAPKP